MHAGKHTALDGAIELEELIRARYEGLPKNQKKAGDFLLQRSEDVPFLSILQIERESGTSKATIVRLAQSLGFSGFQELRARLLERARERLVHNDLFTFAARGMQEEETLTAVARQDVKNINRTVRQLDRRTFHAVAGLIVKAAHVYTLGLGISSLMSQILAYSLSQVGVRAAAFIHDYETFAEQIPFLTQKDLLIAFSFPPYSRETVDVVRDAAAARVPVVGITDKLTSPVSFHCVRVLPVRSQNRLFTNSFSAISVLLNALATEVAQRNRKRATGMMKRMDRLLQESGHYLQV